MLSAVVVSVVNEQTGVGFYWLAKQKSLTRQLTSSGRSGNASASARTKSGQCEHGFPTEIAVIGGVRAVLRE